MSQLGALTARCQCGRVVLETVGQPIVCATCYCNDCQAGSGQIAQLPGADAVLDADGGTTYVLFRKDRVTCTSGSDLLAPRKLRDSSATSRVITTCCHSAMMIAFDKGPFWVSIYRARLQGDKPPLQMRICTKTRPAGIVLPDDVPNHAGMAPGLVLRLLAIWVAKALGR